LAWRSAATSTGSASNSVSDNRGDTISDEFVSTNLILDDCVDVEIKAVQTAMDAEISRLQHLSHLMDTLYRGIDSATTDLQQTFTNESSTITTECQTFANENPTFANERNERQTLANENPPFAHERQTFANENPTSINAPHTFANENPLPAERPADPLITNGLLPTTTIASLTCVPEFILMITDLSLLEAEERTIIEINAERSESLSHELHQLSLEEQRTHDLELSQLRDDVLQHENATVNQIIASFEHHQSSSEENDDFGIKNDDFGSGSIDIFNRVCWDEPPDSSEVDALIHNFAQIEREYNLDAWWRLEIAFEIMESILLLVRSIASLISD
jgi:hypothetical protein